MGEIREGMLALSVRLPWALLIVRGAKDIENRNRAFWRRGPVLIHASKALDTGYYMDARRWVLRHVPGAMAAFPSWEECEAARGMIVGGTTFAGCDRETAGVWRDKSEFGIRLRDSWRAARPVAAVGSLGLWTYRRVAR